MISGELVTALALRVKQELGIDLVDPYLQAVSGGDSHQAYQLKSKSDSLFVKVNTVSHKKILESEYDSLVLLSKTDVADLYPRPYFHFELGELAILAMSYRSLTPIDYSNASRCADGLVRHHKVVAQNYGWSRDNYIGSVPQKNTASDDWLSFFHEQRLMPQFVLASQNGLSRTVRRGVEVTFDRLGELLPSTPAPSLLHGDLWCGNLAYCKTQQTLSVFDPAPYYGDPEVDVAMTKLFGTLEDEFYLTYRASFPKPKNETKLHAIYNLYHALNHFNLFGTHYEALISRHLELVQ